MNEWLSLPQLASQHGGALDHTLGLVHWLMLMLFVGWGSFFVYVLCPLPREARTRWPTPRASPATPRPGSRAPWPWSRRSC